jgi:uracil-DNA glycosylase
MTAEPFVPKGARSLTALADAGQKCQGCPLYLNATQAVFGSGPRTARVVLVGEQPGDVEDREGDPFVGPSGHLLDRALLDVGLDRREVYLTNAVKHFKFTLRGKRRFHDKPNRAEITACHPWLEAELDMIQPAFVAALGATAAQALLGPNFRVTKERGQIIEVGDRKFLATVHPSAVLRSPQRDEDYAGLVRDLAVLAEAVRP